MENLFTIEKIVQTLFKAGLSSEECVTVAAALEFAKRAASGDTANPDVELNQRYGTMVTDHLLALARK